MRREKKGIEAQRMDVFREGKWSFAQKGDCVWVTYILSQEI